MKSSTRIARAVALACLLAAGTAVAVHDEGLFELDTSTIGGVLRGNANTSDESTKPGDDWASVYAGTDSAIADPAFIEIGVEEFVSAAENSFFTGGGSKDTNKIEEWLYGTTNDVVPDKDDISSAFAAPYKDADGNLIFYFGADRFDPGEGTAEIGFWFFRDRVTMKPAVNGQGGFNGTHQDGDLLILADFTNGGDAAGLKIYKWDTSANNVALVSDITNADCAGAGASDMACAVTNNVGGEDPPWSYGNNDGGTAYDPQSLFEGGINVTKLLGGDVGCFGSFMAETRSSGSSINAQLKDFALGDFPLCGIKVTKDGDTLSKVGETVTYTITVQNTGFAKLYKKSITDSLLGDLGSYCDAYLMPNDGQAGGSDECTFTYTRQVKASDPNPVLNKVTVVYTEKADFTGTSVTDSYQHGVDLFKPSITLTKTATPPVPLYAGDNVKYDIVLTDTSSANTPQLTCKVIDKVLDVSKDVTLGSSPDTTSLYYAWTGLPTNANCAVQGDGSYLCKNTASTSCTVDGFPNILKKEASVTVKVLPKSPIFTVAKTGDAFSKVGDDVTYKIVVQNLSPYPLSFVSIGDTLLGDLKAKCPDTLAKNDDAPGGGDECVITYVRTVKAEDPDPLKNTVSVTMASDQGDQATNEASWTVELIQPAVAIAKTCTPTEPVPPGTIVSFDIQTTNTGNADLVVDVDDSLLGKLADDVPLPPKGSSCVYGDAVSDTADGCYLIEKSYEMGTSDVTNTAKVTAFLSKSYGDLQLGGMPNKYEKSASATCTVKLGGPTRTWGFWKTHGSDGDRYGPPDYPWNVKYGYTGYITKKLLAANGGVIDLGWTKLYSKADVFGLFWSKKPGCDNLTKLRLQASFQYLSAMLNDKAFGTAIPGTCTKGSLYAGMSNSALFSAMRTALAAGDEKKIRSLMSVFACFNEYGDDQSIMDTVPVPPADPNGTRAKGADDMYSCK